MKMKKKELLLWKDLNTNYTQRKYKNEIYFIKLQKHTYLHTFTRSELYRLTNWLTDWLPADYTALIHSHSQHL